MGNIRDYSAGFNQLAQAMDKGRKTLDDYTAQTKWLRFDTVIGPMTGACVICGIILIAAIGSWLS